MRGLAVPSVAVLSIAPETTDAVTLKLQISLDFKAGQSITVRFPGDLKKRYYSLSSSPSESDHIAITIKTPKDSPMAKTLAAIKPGDLLPIDGPIGSFHLAAETPATVCFLAAGSGVTPCRSMIKYLLDRHIDTQIWLFHSVPSGRDLIFQNEMTSWSSQNKNFHYLPTITREARENWTMSTGRIGEDLLKKHLLLTDEVFYLCGPTEFVGDMERLLRETLRVPTTQIRREQW